MNGLAEVQEEKRIVEKARETLVQLKRLLPELLTRCQLVSKWRAIVLQGNETDSDRASARLASAQEERDALRSFVNNSVDSCGELLQDVKLLVTACVSLDDKMLDMPIQKAVTSFCRSCTTRRAEFLQRLKELRKAEKAMSTSNQETIEKSDSSSSIGMDDSEEALLLRQHLMDLNKLLERLQICDKMLASVRASRYISKYEDERASIQLERKALAVVLERWIERNRASETKVWRDQHELVNTILVALEEELDNSLVAAIKDDIDRFAFNSTWFPQFAKLKSRTRKKRPDASVPRDVNKARSTLQGDALSRCVRVSSSVSETDRREEEVKERYDEETKFIDKVKLRSAMQRSPRRLPARNAGFAMNQPRKAVSNTKNDRNSRIKVTNNNQQGLVISGCGF